jgi:hypothetical protein
MKRLPQRTSVDLAKWLAAQLSDECMLVVLRHRGADADQQVREWPLASDTDVNDIADQIEACAHEDGRHFRGPTVYGVFAYREAGKAAVARTLLRIEGQGAAEAFMGETETADARGITSQLMRHNEVAARMALGTTADIIEYYRRALDARDRRIDELESRHFKTLELYEDLQSMRHEREIDVIREHRADQRTQFLKEKLDMLAPVLMNKLLGKGASGGAGAPALGEELMRQFLKSLTPQQIEALMGMLRPEQAAVIGEVYEAYAKRESAKDGETTAESRH